MKITFIGLSSFLIENNAGYRILIDPFDDSPEWTLGPVFPRKFNGRPFGTNILLLSETDPDHARNPAGYQQNAPQVAVHSNPFPNFDLRGTVIQEYNGELCIAWHYTVDGIRLANFSDNAHILTENQLQEIGNPDIIFYPLPKVKWKKQNSFNIIRENIKKLNPKLVIWSHHIVPSPMPLFEDSINLKQFFIDYFRKNASTNKGYKGEESFMELYYMIESGHLLTKEFNGNTLANTVFEIDKDSLKNYEEPAALFFYSNACEITI